MSEFWFPTPHGWSRHPKFLRLRLADPAHIGRFWSLLDLAHFSRSDGQIVHDDGTPLMPLDCAELYDHDLPGMEVFFALAEELGILEQADGVWSFTRAIWARFHFPRGGEEVETRPKVDNTTRQEAVPAGGEEDKIRRAHQMRRDGVSQRAIARKLGVDEKTVRRYLRQGAAPAPHSSAAHAAPAPHPSAAHAAPMPHPSAAHAALAPRHAAPDPDQHEHADLHQHQGSNPSSILAKAEPRESPEKRPPIWEGPIDRIPFGEKDFQSALVAGFRQLLGRDPTRYDMANAAKMLANIEGQWEDTSREVKAHCIRFACHLIRERIEKKKDVTDPVRYTIASSPQFVDLVKEFLDDNRFWASKGRQPRPIDHAAYFRLDLAKVA